MAYTREISTFATDLNYWKHSEYEKFYPLTFDETSSRAGNVNQFSLSVINGENLIFFQRYDSYERGDSSATEVNIYGWSEQSGAEILTNNFDWNSVSLPQSSNLNSGEVVVIWQSHGQDGMYQGIYGVVTSDIGEKISEEFQVNTNTWKDQYQADLVTLNDGGFFVSWSSYDGNEGPLQTYGRFFNNDGTARSDELRITNDPTSGYTSQFQSPKAVELSNGNILIASKGLSDLDIKIVTQTDGALLYEDKVASGHYSLNGFMFETAALENNNCVVVWLEEDAGSVQVNGAMLSSHGEIVKTFPVNYYTYYGSSEPSVIALDDGGFLVGWLRLGEVVVQRFNAECDAIGQQIIDLSSPVTKYSLDYQVTDTPTFATNFELDSIDPDTVRISYTTSNSGFGQHIETIDFKVGFAGTNGEDEVSIENEYSFVVLGEVMIYFQVQLLQARFLAMVEMTS